MRPFHRQFQWLAWLLFLALLGGEAAGAPAAPLASQARQPDGTTFQLHLKGDEWGHWHETHEGHTVLRNARRQWVYALPGPSQASPSGGAAAVLAESAALVGVDDAITKRLPKHLRPGRRFPAASPGAVGTGAAEAAGASPRPIQPISGTIPTLVILGYYDDALSAPNCTLCGRTEADTFQNIAFGAEKSLKNYYGSVSLGKLSMAPVAEASGTANDGVVGWLRLGDATPESAISKSSIYKSNKIAADAINAAMAYVDFTACDTDNDGYVSSRELALIVVLAGYEAAYGADASGKTLAADATSPRIWAHAWKFYPAASGVPIPTQTVGGKTVSIQNPANGHSYTIFGERQGNHAATLGVMAHELGHLVFGLPDLYDTSGTSSGIGYWGLMSSGGWGRANSDAYPGQTPVAPEAWSRVSLGWVAPTVFSASAGGQALSAAGGAAPSIFRINTSNPAEYFLVENRQDAGYDAGLEQWFGASFGGLAVWHVDDSVADNSNVFRKRVDLIAAQWDSRLDYGFSDGAPRNLYYFGNKTSLDVTTVPNTRLYSGAASGFGLANISASAYVMTTDVMVGVSPQTGWWWNPVEGGRGFMIEVRGSNMFMATFLYDATGRASWYVASGPMTTSALFQGTLQAYANGQTLTGSYRPNTPIGSAGNITIQFIDATHGTITWPGGTIPIERFNIVPGGLSAPPATFQPETGWWWNAAESGRGFGLEIQKGTVFLAGFMYDGSGNPIWYLTQNAMTFQNLYQGQWTQYANGQTLTGSYRSAVMVNGNVGSLTIQFRDTRNGILTLPDGRQIPITRFVF